MKIKNKGKVHPSPPPSSSSSSSSSSTTLNTANTTSSYPVVATLQLLPAAVLALASVLPPPDQQVLSYLLSRYLQLSSSSIPSNRRHSPTSLSSLAAHRTPSFDCDCFECYTIFWLRWDASANRDLIHRIIDAYEDRLSSSSSSSPSPSSSNSSSVTLVRKAKVGGGRSGGKQGKDRTVNREKRERTDTTTSQKSRGNGGDAAGRQEKKRYEDDDEAAFKDSLPGSPLPPPWRRCGGGEHKGWARKVLSDVLGILNSRLWNMWSPNVLQVFLSLYSSFFELSSLAKEKKKGRDRAPDDPIFIYSELFISNLPLSSPFNLVRQI